MSSSNKPDEIEDIDQNELPQTPTNAEDSLADEAAISDAELIDESVEEVEGDGTAEDVAEEVPEEEAPEPVEPEQPQVTTPEPVAAPAASSSGGGFLPTLLGGVLAAGLGFGVSQFLFTDATPPTVDISELESALEKQSRDIAALAKSVVSLSKTTPSETPDMTGPLDALKTDLTDAIGAVGTDISDLTAQIDALETRLSEVEKRPVIAGDTSGAVAAYERELNAIREELASQQAKNEEMSAQVGAAADAAKAEIDAASARARALEAQAAIQAVQSALDTGTSYAASLSALPGEVPEALTVSAQTGVATLPELKDSFDAFARKALSASLKDAPGETAQDRIGSFLRSQLNIRSLAPREGDDADAVLSRAQGALTANDLAAALAEITQLPESGQAAMSDWTETAQARLAAKDAIETLAQSLSAK